MNKYKDWDLFENLPEGWKIDKTCGSPLTGYEFCITGSILKGGKRALVRTDKSKLKSQNEPAPEDNTSTEKIEKKLENYIFPTKTLNTLARKKFQEIFLKEILFDLMVCELEGWNKKEYIKELKILIDGINIQNKKTKSTKYPALFN